MSSNQQDNEESASDRTPRTRWPTKKVRENEESGVSSPGFASSPLTPTSSSRKRKLPASPHTSVPPSAHSRSTQAGTRAENSSPTPSAPRPSPAPPEAAYPSLTQESSQQAQSPPPPPPISHTETSKSGPSQKSVASEDMVRGGVTKRGTTRRAPKPTQRAQQARQNLSNAAPAPATKQHTFAPDGSFIPELGPDRFQIYQWPLPAPQDFTNLSGEHRRFKEMKDSSEGDFLFGDEDDADDWTQFVGDVNEFVPIYFGSERKAETLRAYGVARNFLSRAKRAFRNGKSWDGFYEEERSINSEAAAEREPDLQKKILLARSCLRNDVRLAIFEVLKARLRAEIWLEHGTNEDSEAASETQEMQKPRDSKVPTRLPSPTGAAPNQTSRSMPTLPAALGTATETSTSGWKTNLGGLQAVPIFKNGTGEEAAGEAGEESEDEVDLDEFSRSLPPLKRVRCL